MNIWIQSPPIGYWPAVILSTKTASKENKEQNAACLDDLASWES